MMSQKKKESRSKASSRQEYLNIDISEFETILSQALKGPISGEDHAKLQVLLEMFVLMTQELKNKRVSINRLRTLIFGPKTEKTKDVLGDRTVKKKDKSDEKPDKSEKKRKGGNGRNSADSYTGAEKISVPHPTLQDRDVCPGCEKGRVYMSSEPCKLVRITGVAPLSGKVYVKEKLRCNACGEVFTAPSPEGIGEEKYNQEAVAMVGLLKYGTGLPFYRLEKMQKAAGIPLPASTQWDLVKEGAEKLKPVFQELLRTAAQGDVLHNDDTNAKILELMKERKDDAERNGKSGKRKGTFTTGIISTSEEHKIALFLTGPNHAGENLAEVLALRDKELAAPIQMCDGLSRNKPGEFERILSNCNAHARRKYVDVTVNFPEECRYVLETLGEVYKHDAEAKDLNLSPQERLLLHQEKSGPLMDDLEKWMKKQIDERMVEPNSGLGGAIEYMLERWKPLTLFLRVPNAPIDNNNVERALKKAILHRKNALFFKTRKGAEVGDMWMSLIYTSEINGETPFDYIVALLKHYKEAANTPGDWMPWKFCATLAKIKEATESTGPPN